MNNKTAEHQFLYRVFKEILKSKPPFQYLTWEGGENKPLSKEEEIYFENAVERATAKAPRAPQNDPPVQIQSVFSKLLRQSDSEAVKYLPNVRLSLDENYFPDYITAKTENFNGEYDVAKKIPTNLPFEAWLERALNVLHVFAARTPCGYVGLEDVSLYDHLRSVLTFALCEFRSPNKQSFQMIGGGVSGVQKFIYDIINKKAAKNLKGRSFYVQLIADSVVSRVLRGLDLYEFNVVYASGGGFTIIAPDTADFQYEFKYLKEDVSGWLYAKHKINLFLSLASVEVFYNQILNENGQAISEVWKTLDSQLERQKSRRFYERFTENDCAFFAPHEIGGTADRDAITGEECPLGVEMKRLNDGEDDKEEKAIMVLPETRKLYELAEDLRKATYWITKIGSTEIIINDDNHKVYEILGENFRFQIDPLSYPYRSEIFNKPEFWNNPKLTGFKFYGGNQFATKRIEGKNVPKNFNDLAGESAENQGAFTRLGVLRMDVDNLGDLFQRGFDGGIRTFSRYHALSRQLDYFFKGYLNHIWEKEPYKENTFIVYSGGDDLFIVGKWDILIEMAIEINQKFRQWTCHTPNLTLSGGMAIVKPKFPIARSAEMAEDEEKRAKTHCYKSVEKNAFAFLGRAFEWDEELINVHKMKGRLVKAVKAEEVSASLLQKIHTFMTESQTSLRWRWLMAYDMARYKDALAKNVSAETEALIEELVRFPLNILGESSTQLSIADLGFAARWAELELRA